jgi:hypothetical protein
VKNTIKVLLVVVASSFCALQARADSSVCDAAAGNLVSNCGFEVSSTFTSWTLSGNDVPGQEGNLYGVESGLDPVSNIGPNSGNNQAYFGDLPSNPTTLSQNLVTTAGQTYTISFYLAQDTEGPGNANNSVLVDFGGTQVDDLSDVGIQGYTFYSVTDVASSGSTNLAFVFGNEIGQFQIDDIEVVATPEPGSWALLLTGVLLIGWMYRSKSGQALRS